ncbi:methyltransferase [Phenylobacterium sp.]|jgi:predicted methyltransferase|uniref:methyltransferase n=1 Tax=Phenylobacterium sp. TaxID=1871053 RepID=UPI002E378752|nr:methyltransferase [Phenylobacterium sp.]HEX3364754.1 methyltransferase [Phenylobacterium sp.]
MRLLRRSLLALAFSLGAALAAGGALAQPPKFDIHSPIDQSRGDALSNPTYHGPEVLKFMGVKPGWKVADIFPGRFTTAIAQAVGPKGKVYGFMPDEIIKVHPGIADLRAARAKDPAWANVTPIASAMNDMALPDGLDAVFIRQNYHDLHVRFMGPADVPAFNRKVFAALKPGGVFVIIDHVAPAGMDVVQASNRFHRIDPATVKAEVEAAGFKFDGESKVLADPTDDHSKMVLETSILGKTDQFLFRFRKPK